MSSGDLGEVSAYVHGYGEREAQRLMDQAESVRALIHHDTEFPPDSRILEVACGVGAQTVAMIYSLLIYLKLRSNQKALTFYS